MRNLNVVTVHKQSLPSIKTINKGINRLGYLLVDTRIYIGEEIEYKRFWKLMKSC